MFQYVVMVGKLQGELRRHVITDLTGQREIHTYQEQHPEVRDLANGSPWVNTEWLTKVTTVYCPNEDHAQQVALVIAKAQPGRQVYVMKIIAGAACTPGDPVLQSVSEKGVLPK